MSGDLNVILVPEADAAIALLLFQVLVTLQVSKRYERLVVHAYVAAVDAFSDRAGKRLRLKFQQALLATIVLVGLLNALLICHLAFAIARLHIELPIATNANCGRT